jgi:ferrochelatase
MKYIGQTHFNHEDIQPKRAVLLCNLGTPEAPTAPALRRYLRQFLSDSRVVELPALLWKVILYLFVLTFRPKRSAALYKKVWTQQGSPLMVHSLAQQEQLQANLFAAGLHDVIVETTMCYGQPSVSHVLNKLKQLDVREIMIIPMYPQYSGATTGATFDSLARVLMRYRWVPQLHFLNGYHQHPLYIQALATSIQQHLTIHGQPDIVLFSYHGTPLSYLKKGDPYHCFCHQTTRRVLEYLGWSAGDAKTCFQSRFGKNEWLQPYTEATLIELAEQGLRHVAVICPGFSADCLETIDEIEREAREVFLEHGGQTFHYIPALNATSAHIEMLSSLVQQQLHSVAPPKQQPSASVNCAADHVKAASCPSA